jgi:hypothetical protein
VEGTDSYDLAIPDEDKKISEMVIEFAKRPGEDPSSRSVDLKQPLNLFDVIEFSLSNHFNLFRVSLSDIGVRLFSLFFYSFTDT